MQHSGGNAAARRGYAVAALALFALPLVPLYASNPGLGRIVELTTAGLTAHSLIRDGDVCLEEYFPGKRPGARSSYAVRWRGDCLTGIEPIASSLTFAPFLLPFRSLEPGVEPVAPHFPVVAASVAALAIFVFGVCLLGVTSTPRALAVTAIVALATSHRTITGGGLWQHTSAALWLALGLLLWTRAARKPSLTLWAGAALAGATVCRPIHLPAPLLLLVDAWLVARPPLRTRVLATLAVVAIGGAAIVANVALHGAIVGGRVDIAAEPARYAATSTYFDFSPMNWAGLLFAPSRGLFVYSPILLFALAGLVRCLRAPDPPALRWISISGLCILLVYGWIATWWGGVAYGPRYGTDLLFFFGLWLALTPIPRRARSLWIAAACTALLWSLAVQEIGVRAYPCGWNTKPVHVNFALERLWDASDTQIGRCVEKLRRGKSGLHRVSASPG